MKTKTREVQTNKAGYLSDEAFADLKEAMEDALAFERGRRRDLKVTQIHGPRPPKTSSPPPIAHRGSQMIASPRAIVLQDNI